MYIYYDFVILFTLAHEYTVQSCGKTHDTKCSQCPVGEIWSNTAHKCRSCIGDPKCPACPIGHVWSATRKKCAPKDEEGDDNKTSGLPSSIFLVLIGVLVGVLCVALIIVQILV